MVPINNLVKNYGTLLLLLCCTVFVTREIITYTSHPSCTTLRSEIKSALIEVTKDAEEDSVDMGFLKELEPEEKPRMVEKRHFEKHRLKIWYGGRCVGRGPSTNKLLVSHCDPDADQTFSLQENGFLVFDYNGLCVTAEGDSDVLGLGSCESAIKFILSEEQYLRTEENDLCMSPVESSRLPSIYSCINADIALTQCQEEASRFEVIPETDFREDRKAFVLAKPKPGHSCDFKACGINDPAPPVKKITPLYHTRCTDIFDCVTVVTKTARRPYLVIRLVKSIKELKGYDLRVIAYDDGPDDYPPEVWEAIRQYPHLEYIVGDDDDMGISTGRNLALQRVKTKYFLLVDDDHVFNNKTNLEKMTEILDTTDATLVGGKFEGFMKFAGALRFGYYHDRKEFAMFSGHCDRTLPDWDCEQCDSTSNIFMAKTQHIIEIGGWSEELKIAEHADFFVKLKAHQRKVVYCDDIEVINQQETPEERSQSYQKLRYDKRRKNRMFRLMNSRYNVNGLFWCSNYTLTNENELLCTQTKHKIGYC